MSPIWERLAANSGGLYQANDFETAAYRLVSEQTLYYSDRLGRVAYALTDLYENEFNNVLAPLGIRLSVNRTLRYAVALPAHEKQTTVTVAQTLLALALRKIYDESASSGQIEDDGEVVCDLIELPIKYRQLTGREPPSSSELREQFRFLKRCGIVRITDEVGDDSRTSEEVGQPYAVMIRPAIADILGETALHRLGLWSNRRRDIAGKSDDPDQNENSLEKAQ